MNKTPRTPAFKKKVALEAIREEKPVEQIAKDYNLNRVQVSQWKKELLDGAELIFIGKRKEKKALAQHEDTTAALERKIGQLTIENDWLKKKLER